VIEIKRFEKLPFKDPFHQDVWYASFFPENPRVTGHKIYVPKEQTSACMIAAFDAAYRFGSMMQQMGKFKAFHVCIDQGEEAGQEIGWPIIHMLPVTDDIRCCNTATEAASMRAAHLEIIFNLVPAGPPNDKIKNIFDVSYKALGGQLKDGEYVDYDILKKEWESINAKPALATQE
jgi:hypothetical protein